VRGLELPEFTLSFWAAAGTVYSTGMLVLIFFAVTREPFELTLSASLITLFFGSLVLLPSLLAGEESHEDENIHPGL
jgi:hypothetical protein